MFSSEERYVPLWGRCKANHSASFSVSDADYKWRKPEPPVIPDYCYHMVKETYKEKTEKGKMVTKTSERDWKDFENLIINPSEMVRRLNPSKQATNTECVPVVYPDTFSLADKSCEGGCQQWDLNSVCGPEGHCACRGLMKWNSGSVSLGSSATVS